MAQALNEPGGDLFLRPGPGIPRGLLVPAGELVERFSRSSGPGGQSVNTADSRAELVFDVTASSALTDQQKARAVQALGSDRIAIAASEHRSQHRNRSAARERLADLLRDVLAPPPLPRVPTKPTRGSQRRRLEGKKRRGRTKSLRGQVHGES